MNTHLDCCSVRCIGCEDAKASAVSCHQLGPTWLSRVVGGFFSAYRFSGQDGYADPGTRTTCKASPKGPRTPIMGF